MSYESYHRFLQALAATIDESADADAIVAVTGLRGTGKSTFTLGATMRIEKYVDGDWSVRSNVLWTYDQAYKALTDESSIHAGVVDEGVFVALNRDWNKSGQKKLLKLINASREYHKITFWNIPYFRRLDTGIREQFTYWVWIPRRGHAMVFAKSVQPFAHDPWNLDYFDKMIIQRVQKSWDVNEVMDAVRDLPNYMMEFKFPKIEDRILQEYKRIAREMKKKVESDDETSDQAKETGLRYYVVNGKKCYVALTLAKAILKSTGIPGGTISLWITQSEHVSNIVVGGSIRRVVYEDDLFDFSRWLISQATDWLSRNADATTAR